MALGTGRLTSTEATIPLPQLTTLAAGTTALLLSAPLSAVMLKRSRAKPVTRTSWPALTRLALLPVKTKMPSELALSPSPLAS